MKKLAALLLAIMVVFTLAGCDNGTSTINSTDGISVEECMLAVIHSKSAAEMAPYVSVGDANDYYNNVKNLFAGDTFSVKAEKSGHYNGYEVFYITIKSNSDKSKTMSNFEIFEKKGNNYYIALDADTINEINQNCVCPTCAGTGGVTTGGNVCGICSGTGVQTIPNAYYDATLNMWMPQTSACGGCGGSGYAGSGTFTPCGNCDGRRYVFE